MRAMTAAMGVVLVAGAATIAVAQPPARTVQQDFEAAMLLDEAPDAPPALVAWQALEARTKPGTRSRAIVLVRKGDALFRVARLEEADVALRAGLAGLPAGDATLRADRANAQLLLGTLARETLDYAGAARFFADSAAADATPMGRTRALLALAQVQTFLDPAAAAATLAQVDTIVGTAAARPVKAAIARRRAILLLNAGDFTGARTQAVAAVTALGGLTEKTDLTDVAARSDAAIAFLLGGNPDEARRYMAMTGAGRLSRGDFNPAAQMQSPDCGGEAGLKPDDVAVVQFSIAPNGAVVAVEPVYAAGGGAVALEFARAVRGWSWPAEQVAAIPPFFRYNARVEMRCSTAFTRPSIAEGLDAPLAQWLEGKGIDLPETPERGGATLVVGQRAVLAAATARSADSLATLAALHVLAANPVVGREETAALSARAAAIAAAHDAPPLARLALDLPARTAGVVDPWRPGAFARGVAPLLEQAPYAADPRARAAIRLAIADHVRPGKTGDAQIMTWLRPVADDPALPKDDAFRVGALVRIASIEQRAGKPDAARAAFAGTGLTADQCAVMDAPPRMVSAPGSDAFPKEALLWGFEGWTQVQYDIGADGRTANARTLLSYPPFIFSQAGSDFATRARFARTFRPDGGPGCGGTTNRIVFRLPG